jgi:hypothetical protein
MVEIHTVLSRNYSHAMVPYIYPPFLFFSFLSFILFFLIFYSFPFVFMLSFFLLLHMDHIMKPHPPGGCVIVHVQPGNPCIPHLPSVSSPGLFHCHCNIHRGVLFLQRIFPGAGDISAAWQLMVSTLLCLVQQWRVPSVYYITSYPVSVCILFPFCQFQPFSSISADCLLSSPSPHIQQCPR